MTLYSVANTCSPTSIMMASRRYLDLLDPKLDDIRLDDIARGLAVPRFRNQCSVPVRVDDHLLRCGRIALALDQPLEVVVACLLHDAAEYAWGDMPGPIKRFMRVEVAGVSVSVGELEHKLLVAIAEVLIPWVELRERVLTLLAEHDGIVKHIDVLALRGEAILWLPGSEDWALNVTHTSAGPADAGIDPRIWPAMVRADDSATWSSWAHTVGELWAWWGIHEQYEARLAGILLDRLRQRLTGRDPV